MESGNDDQQNNSQLSQSTDEMLGFITTPPSSSRTTKKSAPKVTRVKKLNVPEDHLFLSPTRDSDTSRNLQVMPNKNVNDSNMDGSSDPEITFKTPIAKEPARKSPTVDLESPIDLFSQIFPSTLQAACKVAEHFSAQEDKCSQNENGTREYRNSSSSTGFEIQGDDKVLHMSPVTGSMAPIDTATSTPIASNRDKSFDIEITPIGKDKYGTPVRWKEDVASNCNGVPNCTPSPSNTAQTLKIKSGLALRRKSKRFSYPSSSQIKETCPRKVFNFQPRNDIEIAKEKVTKIEETLANSAETELIDDAASKQSKKGSNTVSTKPYWKRYTSGTFYNFNNFSFFQAGLTR